MAESKNTVLNEPWNYFSTSVGDAKYFLFQKRSKLVDQIKNALPDYAIDYGLARMNSDNSLVETNIRVPETKLTEFLAWLTERGISASEGRVPFTVPLEQVPVQDHLPTRNIPMHIERPAFDKWTFESASAPREDASLRRPSTKMNRHASATVTDSTVIDAEQDAKSKQTPALESDEMQRQMAKKLRKQEAHLVKASKASARDVVNLNIVTEAVNKRFANHPLPSVTTDSGRSIETAIIALGSEMAATIVQKLGYAIVGIQMLDPSEYDHIVKCRDGVFLRMMTKDCSTKQDRDFFFDLTEYERQLRVEVNKFKWDSKAILAPLDVPTFGAYNTVVLDSATSIVDTRSEIKDDSKQPKQPKQAQASAINTILQPGQRKCAHCDVVLDIKITKIMRCSRCKKVQYCSPECQAKDWATKHKIVCHADPLSVVEADIVQASRAMEPTVPFEAPYGFIGRGTEGSSSSSSSRLKTRGWFKPPNEGTHTKKPDEPKTETKSGVASSANVNVQLPEAMRDKSPTEFIKGVLAKDGQDNIMD